mgnify:CR=1 FL=1
MKIFIKSEVTLMGAFRTTNAAKVVKEEQQILKIIMIQKNEIIFF